MSGRRPSDTLVVDTNILVTAIMGRVGPDTLLRIGTSRALLTTPETQREARRVLADPRFKRPAADAVAEATFAIVAVQPAGYFEDLQQDAARCLAEAVASANGSPADAHVLALAWAADADIWSHDRDFGGTGWPSWSTHNLRRALDL